MPLTYRIDESAGLITLTLSGKVTAADITDYQAASRKDPSFQPGMHRLVVASGIESFPDLPAVREITKRTQPPLAGPTPRIAAVADTPLGLAMIAMFFGHWGLANKYRLFDDVQSALTWLQSDVATE
jgi:hypothetical protein